MSIMINDYCGYHCRTTDKRKRPFDEMDLSKLRKLYSDLLLWNKLKIITEKQKATLCSVEFELKQRGVFICRGLLDLTGYEDIEEDFERIEKGIEKRMKLG